MGDAGGEESKVGEAAAVQGKIVESAFVEEGGDSRRLRFDQGWCGGDGNIFMSAGDGEVEFEGATAPVSTWSCGVIWGDMPSAMTRAE